MKNYWLNKISAREQQALLSKREIDYFNGDKKWINPNIKFLNEAREIESRWGKTGLLDGIDSRYSRQVTAVLLEGQRLFNEVAPSEEK